VLLEALEVPTLRILAHIRDAHRMAGIGLPLAARRRLVLALGVARTRADGTEELYMRMLLAAASCLAIADSTASAECGGAMNWLKKYSVYFDLARGGQA